MNPEYIEKTVYNYSWDAKIYVGSSVETIPADGSIGLPANCTEVVPPEPEDGKLIVWDGEAWTLQDNIEGKQFVFADNTQLAVPFGVSLVSQLPEEFQTKFDSPHQEITDNVRAQMMLGYMYIDGVWQSRPATDADRTAKRMAMKLSCQMYVMANACDEEVDLVDQITDPGIMQQCSEFAASLDAKWEAYEAQIAGAATYEDLPEEFNWK